MFGASATGAAALAASACGDDYFEPATEHAADAPNVLMLITDSTRADYISHYNPDSLARTPNIDALARDSLVFDHAVPDAMPTGPARRSLLTGVRSFPYRNYVPTKGLPVGPGWTPIPDFQPIVTEVLGEAGVETAYCTDNPFLIGPRFGNFRRTVDWIKPSYSQGAYRFLNKPYKRPAARSTIERYLLPELSDTVEVGRLRAMTGWNSVYRDSDGDYPTARVVRAGLRLLDDLKEEGKPFFLGVDAFDPHEPLDAPRTYQARWGGEPLGTEKQGVIPIQPFETPYSWVIDVDVDDETIERVRQLYAAEIEFVDEWVGRLMNELDRQKLLDNTVVMYMSDHGLTLGEHGVLGKHAARAQWHIYRVPCMIRHPEGKRAGDSSGFFASTYDLPRTALSFMGVRAPGLMSGEDLSVLFEGREPPPRPHFVACYDDHVLAGDLDWFLLSDSEGKRKRLYDKRADPEELTDVAAEHPEVVDRLWRVLEDEAGGTLPQFGRGAGRAVIGG